MFRSHIKKGALGLESACASVMVWHRRGMAQGSSGLQCHVFDAHLRPVWLVIVTAAAAAAADQNQDEEQQNHPNEDEEDGEGGDVPV